MRLPAIALVSFALEQMSNFMARLVPYRERLYRLALAQLRNNSDAEDAVQETLLKAARNAQSFRSESSEYTWVVRILINHCHDMQRKVSRKSRRELSNEVVSHKTAQIADPRQRPEENIELSEVSRHLMEAVNELGEDHKQVILMRYFEELSYEAIASALEIHLGTVKSRMNQAKHILRAKLLERGISEEFLG